MYKLTIERIDPQPEIKSTQVYLTDAEAKLMEASGVKCEKRDADRWSAESIKSRPWIANIPTVDFRRSIDSKIYEQVVDTLVLSEIIKAVNGI